MRIGIGHSLEKDSRQAALEAAREAKKAVPEPQFALAYAGISHDQKAVHEALCSELDPSILIGGSSYAEVSSLGVVKGSVAVLLLSFKNASVRFADAENRGESRVSGHELAAAFNPIKLSPARRPVGFLISAFDNGRENEMLAGLTEKAGAFPLFGGMASSDYDKGLENPAFYVNWQYAGAKLAQKITRMALFDFPGEGVRTAFGFEHGWEPVAPPVTLTRCEGGRVYEIDGQPVFDFYRRLIGPGDSEAFFTKMIQRYGFSLEIGEAAAKRTVLKLPVRYSIEEGWVELYPVEDLQGRTVRMILSSRSSLIAGARRAAERCKAALKGAPAHLILLISCCTRCAILHSKSDEEVDAIRAVFGRDVPIFGFYSGGEVLPFCSSYEEIIDSSCSLSGSLYHATTVGMMALSADEGVEALHTPAQRIGIWSAGILRQLLMQSESVLDQTEAFLQNLSKKSYEDSERIRRQNEIIHRYTPQEVWSQVEGSVARGENDLDDAVFDGCFLFMDVKGFTAFSEKHSSKEVVAALNELFSPATEAVYARGGDVDKFIGDCIFAVFHSPKDALEAGRDILTLFRDAQAKGHPFTVRIGVNGGRAVRANVGSKDRREYTYIGDAVNTAQRLESNCAPGKMLASWGVYEKAGVKFASAEPRSIQAKGKDEAVRAYELSI